MMGDDPPYLSVGTEVSAKYKGAFCEAKIKKVVRSVKCKITYKQGLGTAIVTDDQIKGSLRVNAVVEAKHSDKKDFVEATINKIQDCSQYTVVFDDGDITTLRRTALCLKSGRHFAESETLDQLPLTHPEHFGNPVIGGRRGRRSRQTQDDSSDDEGSPPRGIHDASAGGNGKEGMETEPEIGRVVCVELGDKKKKDNWFPGLVVAPTAQDTVRIRVRDDYLVRSFKDARYYTVPKKEATEFTKDLVHKIENSALKIAVEKAVLFLEKNELPPHWDKDSLFGNTASSGNSDSDGELDSDSSDDEPREEKDHFVAQLYKFMDDRGTPINNCPMIGNEDIDLYRLFRAVYKMGGYNRVTNQNQWKSVTRRLSFSMQSNSSTYNMVKQAYKKFLHSFEDFYRKLGCTMVNHPRGGIRKQRPGRSLIRDKDRNTPVPVPVSQSKPEKEEEEKEKKIVEDEKKEKEKREAKKETVLVKEEEQSRSRKKDDFEESVSGQESDVNVDGEEESSSSEKSQKSTSTTRSNSVMGRVKYKSKEKDEVKKKTVEKRKGDTRGNQEKKEEKNKEEDTAKTRSKSKDADAATRKTNGDIIEPQASSSSKEPEKKVIAKQKRISDEELKKRGRKRKDTESDKSRVSDDKSVEYAPSYKGPIEVGDRLKVYYGPTHESKVTYEAKVVDVDSTSDPTGVLYLVHYTGWNTRYDEWIKASRIAQNFTQTQGRVKRAKTTPRPQTPGANSISSSSGIKPSSKVSAGSNGRRRAQSVAPTTTDNAFKETKKEEKEKDKESTRSTTPTSSCGSRTKSPATPLNSRLTRGTRNADMSGVELRRRLRKVSGQTDVSLAASDSEDTNSYESDTTEPEQTTKTKVKGTEERNRREARRRAESRMKVEDTSDVEAEKEANEEPRRGRRLRRSLGKIIQDTRSEADSDEEQPKGRDFDLNQIRSELKGFDKAVKLEMMHIEPEPEETKENEKESLEKTVLVSPTSSPTKVEKKTDVKIEPIIEPKAEENTEDIYEFKEPEPFEFEVRNKRDSSGDKDKLKKRSLEDDLKSPKKKQKIVAPVKEIKPEVDNSNDYKKRNRKAFGKKTEDVQPAATCKETFDTMCEIPALTQQSKTTVTVPEDSSKSSGNLDLLFTDLPGDTDCPTDDAEDRLVISEAEVSEAEQDNPFTYQQEIFPSKEASENTDFSKDEVKATTEQEEITKSNVDVSKTNYSIEQKTVVKSPLPISVEITKSVDIKPFAELSPIMSPTLVAAIPINARLPATSTIEEKLSAAIASAKKDIKKDDDTVEKKATKETFRRSDITETTMRVDGTNTRKTGKKAKEEQVKTKYDGSEMKKQLEVENLRKQDVTKIEREETEEEEEAQRTIPKLKEDFSTKLKKETETKNVVAEAKVEPVKNQAKPEEAWIKVDSNQSEHWECKIMDAEKRKPVVNQDLSDSTDSSDSERRLIIDNEEFQEDKSSTFEVKQKSDLDRLQSLQDECTKPKVQILSKSARTDEDRDNLNSLLCEEEIPGSPTSDPEEKDEPEASGSTSRSSPKASISESTIVLMEMPFASAPTSDQSKSCDASVTMSMVLPQSSCSMVSLTLPVQHAPLAPVRQQHLEMPQPAVPVVVQQHQESNEAAPVMDNTPPTTPDSSISNMSESPREERTGGSSPMSEDNSKPNRDSSERETETALKIQSGHSEDDVSLLTAEGSMSKPSAKRTLEDTTTPKKRKRSRKHSETGSTVSKRSSRQSGRSSRHGVGSDSDDTSEGSNLYATNITTIPNTNITTPPVSVNNNVADHGNYSSRSPRPMKYNFYVELDPELDGSQRIAVLQQKLSELRKTYNAVKVELAAIERRRKKLKRREREAMKAAKAEMQQACS